MTTFEFPLVVERDGPGPMAAQIAAQVRAAVESGALAGGQRLPSTREAARLLGVSRTVLTSAYTQLFAEGWLEGRHGSGTYVAEGADLAGRAGGADGPGRPGVAREIGLAEMAGGASIANRADRAVRAGWPGEPAGRTWSGPLPDRMIDLRPGYGWAAGIDPAMWRRAWRAAGSAPPAPDRPDPAGLAGLREEVVSYLKRSRGLACPPDRVLITGGVAAGLSLLAGVLIRPGDRVGVEDPGWVSARGILRRAGAEVVPCRVDAEGIVVPELPRDLRLLYLTPSHQYPLGGRLPVPRRRALVAWARRTGALLAEDDYDSEFRYDVAPLPALAGLAPDRVVYLGTTAKTLTPATGVGWLVAGPALTGQLAEAAWPAGARVSEPAQRAVQALLGSGDLDRHVHRMRREYARRREVLTGELRRVRGLRLLGDTAGLHVTAELPSSVPGGPGGSGGSGRFSGTGGTGGTGLGTAERVARAARDRGVAVEPLDRYQAGPVTRQALVIGYGAASLAQVRRGSVILRDLLS